MTLTSKCLHQQYNKQNHYHLLYLPLLQSTLHRWLNLRHPIRTPLPPPRNNKQILRLIGPLQQMHTIIQEHIQCSKCLLHIQKVQVQRFVILMFLRVFVEEHGGGQTICTVIETGFFLCQTGVVNCHFGHAFLVGLHGFLIELCAVF